MGPKALDRSANKIRLPEVSADMEEGRLTLKSGCQDVTENIALVFSVAVIAVLCEPRLQVRQHSIRHKADIDFYNRGH